MTRRRRLHTGSQRAVMALAVAAALTGIAVVGYLGWMGPPAPDGTAGAIGAEKYRAPQIGAADVVLARQGPRARRSRHRAGHWDRGSRAGSRPTVRASRPSGHSWSR